jgi:hypothetical protein
LPEQEIDFGFLFCQVSHFYSMSYREVMEMPIMSFWLMNGNIRRVRADADMRALLVNAASQSSDGVTSYRERLVLELGTVISQPVVPDEERDEEGFAELKAMAASM